MQVGVAGLGSPQVEVHLGTGGQVLVEGDRGDPAASD